MQFLLNNCFYDNPAVPFLPIDGQADQALDAQITLLQKERLKNPKPDGRLDRSGKSIAFLRAQTVGSFLPKLYGQEQNFDLWASMNTETMLRLTQRQFGPLNQASMDGFRGLFGRILADPKLYDIRWGAYMLATVKAETAVYLPIEEHKALWSKKSGAGGYAEEITPKDSTGTTINGADGKPLKARYFGRGYVQLTWAENYRAMGQALGLGDGLLAAPERALEAEIAYRIASLGMREGRFSSDKKGKAMSLPRFINGSGCNYRYARQIINGLDRADEIERYAIAFEVLMLLSTSGPPKGA
ncbi:hypothetical protein [Falsiroseomonas sp. E2-1-a20]|uniref:hypothetical protein n=1 Tax=Falsiroseomonas sp. E2-1-a20 TaxID=3239300 RepID=UPI003F2C6534